VNGEIPRRIFITNDIIAGKSLNRINPRMVALESGLIALIVIDCAPRRFIPAARLGPISSKLRFRGRYGADVTVEALAAGLPTMIVTSSNVTGPQILPPNRKRITSAARALAKSVCQPPA
jgi:hypothetical protein